MSGSTHTQLKGGRLQRKRQRDELAQSSDPLSSDAPARAFRSVSLLARWLVEEFHFGFLSAAQVQFAAQLASIDGIDNDVLNKLASFGSNGKYPNKVAGEIEKYMETYIKPAPAPKPQGHEIPLKICKGPMTGYHLMQQYYNLPHVWFAFMYAHFRSIYELRIRGAADALPEFWGGMDKADPRLTSFPFLRSNDIRAKTYPLIVHGDGVPCTNKGSLDSISVESLCAKFSRNVSLATRDIIFLVTGVMSQAMVAKEDEKKTEYAYTKHAMLAPVVDSWLLLESGQFEGNDIAGGDRFIIWAVKGDAEFYCNFFDLPGHWSSNHPCTCCPAHADPTHPDFHLDFSPSAPWKLKTFKLMAKWFEHCRAMEKAPNLLLRPRSHGGLGLVLLAFLKDLLHVGDLGVVKHTNGNILWLLVFSDIISTTRETNMATVWREVQAAYNARGSPSQFSYITISSFCDPKAPGASPPAMGGKGAENRHLLPILASIWEKYYERIVPKAARAGDEHVYERIVLKAARALEGFYDAVDYKTRGGYHPMYLPPEVRADLSKHCDVYLQCYAWLHHNSDGRDLWHLVSKHHSLWHLSAEAVWLSPKVGLAYANEDFMQVTSRIGYSCRHGTRPADRSKPLMTKYMTGSVLRMFHEANP